MKEDLDNLYLAIEEPQKSTLLTLRDIILKHDKNISETQKYGMPCFLYDKNIMCYLWVDKKTKYPYILFAEGNYIDNPHLERGSRSRMKILPVDPNSDIPVNIINSALDDAISLYTKGIVKLK